MVWAGMAKVPKGGNCATFGGAGQPLPEAGPSTPRIDNYWPIATRFLATFTANYDAFLLYNPVTDAADAALLQGPEGGGRLPLEVAKRPPLEVIVESSEISNSEPILRVKVQSYAFWTIKVANKPIK